MKKLGLNAELDSSDWGTLVIRRASKKPVEEGGWSIFGTGWTGVETLDPSADLPLAANGDAAWFGWPSEEKLEALRTEWLKTADSEARQEIAVKIQARAFETLPYVPTGQWSPVTAYRLPQEHQGRHHRPGIVHVERREDLKRSAATLARIAPRLLISSH